MDAAIFGPPGAGKGTQAAGLCARFGWLHLATGDVLRHAIASGDELGRQVQAIVESGRLVDDRTMARVVGARLDEPDTVPGVLFDGFPRTVAQVEALDRLLTERSRRLGVVLELKVSDGELIQRLTQRRSCLAHGPLPPGAGPACPSCGKVAEVRADDTEEVIRQRLQVYRSQTEPVADLYRERDLLRSVDGEGAPDEVSRRLQEVVESLETSP